MALAFDPIRTFRGFDKVQHKNSSICREKGKAKGSWGGAQKMQEYSDQLKVQKKPIGVSEVNKGGIKEPHNKWMWQLVVKARVKQGLLCHTIGRNGSLWWS